MTYFLKIIALIFLMAFFFSCEKSRLNTKEIAREVADRKIKRVTEGDITNTGYDRGEKFSLRADSLWSMQPKEKQETYKAENNFSEFEKFLRKQDEIKTVRIINAVNLPADLSVQEQSVAEAYAYSIENQQTLEKNIQITEEDIIFTSPFPTNSAGPYILYAVFRKRDIIRGMKTP